MHKENSIKNIIFDMGGVLVDLDAQRCIDAFERLGASNVADYVRDFRTEDLFLDIETGRMTTQEFCNEVRRMSGCDASDEAVIAAWNALLLPTDEVKKNAILSYRKAGYKTMILSNTNQMHWEAASRKMIPHEGRDISDYFDRAFLSHEMGVRKPDAEIYRQVLERAGILPEETIFIDDNEMNVVAARESGIRAFHEKEGHRWIECLDKELT